MRVLKALSISVGILAATAPAIAAEWWHGNFIRNDSTGCEMNDTLTV
jgi:hypothetical protein